MDDAAAVEATPAPAAPRRRGRRWVWFLLVVLVFVVFVAVAGVALAGVRADLEKVRAEVSAARTALGAAEWESGLAHLQRAREAADAAQARTDGGVLAVAARVPGMRSNVGAVDALADVAALTTRAATTAVEGLQELPGGIGALAPSGGRMPVDHVGGLAEPMAEAAADISAAEERLARVSEAWLVPPVSAARREAEAQVRQAEDAVGAAAALTRALPGFLGVDGPRRYFFAASNPAELRGTGGLLGAYSVLTVEDGGFSFDVFGAPEQKLLDVDFDEVEAPSEEFRARYDRFGGAGFWQNINMTPDFPSAAQAILALYEVGTGDRLDGVLAVDPEALAALMEITGPATIPGLGEVTADTVVAAVANEAYAHFETQAERQQVLGSVAAQVFAKVLQGGVGDPVALARALGAVAGGGHLQMYSADAEEQEAFVTARVAGAVTREAPGDYLNVVVNNAAGNKVDYYADRTLEYEVYLDPDGTAWGFLTVTFSNDAPTTGQPPYVIGPAREWLAAGENVSHLSVFCSAGCELEGVDPDDSLEPVERQEEFGLPAFTSFETIPPGAERSLTYTFRTPNLLERVGRGGSARYVLDIDGQVTLRPTALRLSVYAPEGMVARAGSEGMTFDGEVARWEGELAAHQRFRVDVGWPQPRAAWHGFLDVLQQPVF